MMQIGKRLEWDAAHRILNHESKCATLHGHRYAAEIVVTADALDALGRVVDFGIIKSRVGDWIDRHWDHNTFVNAHDTALLTFCLDENRKLPFVFDGEPTVENVVVKLMEAATHLLSSDTGLRVVRVRVYETPTCYAEVSAP
jgi:6-pyruvoyltetrahydropterin/6-carboxytetrahydropterin synthase